MVQEAGRAPAAIVHVAAIALAGPPVDPRLRVALHFHPDADAAGRAPLLQMLHDGRYVSQFATGTSNGGLTGRVHGDRWRWEHRIFGGYYDDAPALERPVYGALQLEPDRYGPAPRFGSAHLRLASSCAARATFAFPDSVFEPEAFGVNERMGLAGLLAMEEPADPLDRYVEAHVHGGVLVPEDVEALVLDPCYRGTDLEAAARSHGLQVEWHAGYSLAPDLLDAHGDYRGSAVVALGRRLAGSGDLTPVVLGEARSAGCADPQLLKQLWHCVAAFGRREGAGAGRPVQCPERAGDR